MSSDLQNKMFHFEADPPEEVWNKIADALDGDAGKTFPQRLFDYEEQPPVTTWNKIETGLDEPGPAIDVVPFTRFKKPLRYAAAAASIIAIVFLALNLADKNVATGSVLGGTETLAPTNQSSILPLDQPNIAKDPDIAEKQATIKEIPEEPIEATRPQRKRTPASIRPQNIFSSFSFSQPFIPQKANIDNRLDFSDADSYMVYSDGDGNAMRVPKKLFHLVYCEDGDDHCRERIRQLQKRMAATATTNDFVGVIEILRQLQ